METIEARQLTYDRTDISDEKLLHLYKAILKPRMIEEKMLILLRQGRISKWFSGIGQEAVSVGACEALLPEEYILPMHRNLGVFTSRGVKLSQLFKQFQGKLGGFTKGRDRSFHFGSKDHRIVGMISHLGPQLGVADGIALASKLNNEKLATLVFSGDGGASEGDFHEALNTAAVWDLPVVFVIENNGYGLSTPSNEQFRCKQFIDKGVGYGMDAIQIAGNNILEVYSVLSDVLASVRMNPRPVLVECMTFRMRGHEEASGTKYVPKELMEEWGQKDPVVNYERFLLEEGILNEGLIQEIRHRLKTEIDSGLEEAYAEAPIVPDTEAELADVYAPYDPITLLPNSLQTSERRLIDAISDGLRQSMEKHPDLVLMGQDIAEYGGVFKITEGFVDLFGKARVRNTPLCESAILGAGLGLSIKGMKSMVEMQFADFVSEGMTQIINNLAKSHYRWGQQANVVVRMPTGAGVAAGPFHSQSNETWFAHTPGLRVVYPSNPFDAKGLLCEAFNDPNPVMFFEHKALYRSIKGQVPDSYYTLPFGQANVVRKGSGASIITYGMGVHWALAAADKHPDWDLEVVDLRTLLPLDEETIYQSVLSTGRALVLHEDTMTGGFGSELSARIQENCFHQLDAPVLRCASLDTPVPFAPSLEENFLALKRLEETLANLIAF